MDRKELMELFNKRPRIGSLATASIKGEVNAAVFGSPRMIDENTVVMGVGKSRSLQNLQENPKAVFIVIEPAEASKEWKGVRVYLEALVIETEGPFFDQVKENSIKAVGKEAAERLQAAIRFKVKEVRPLIDPL
jgi:hypothetical protein